MGLLNQKVRLQLPKQQNHDLPFPGCSRETAIVMIETGEWIVGRGQHG